MREIQMLVQKARLRLVKLHYHARCGHLGGNLSCIDALIVLHHVVMQSCDRFLLSKGHSAGALYTTLWSLGKLSEDILSTFTADDTLLPGHPSGCGIPELLFPTGSLGHGPSLAAGLALAARHQDSGRHVYCLCSDGEWQEGACWEALTFAVHQQLGNLTIIIDQNGLQGFGSTEEVISCGDLTSRIKSFGASVQHIDGHNLAQVATALKHVSGNRPTVLIMDTIKGRGTHFSGKVESHYLPLSHEQYFLACAEIQKECAE